MDKGYFKKMKDIPKYAILEKTKKKGHQLWGFADTLKIAKSLKKLTPSFVICKIESPIIIG